MSDSQTAEMQSRVFEAETQKLLDLMIHSLYSNKEVFLRELISNASDALDRRRFEALSESSLASDTPAEISLLADAPARELTLADNGIGMSRDEVIEHLGTIARSGTLEFLRNVEAGEDRAPELIGQFGVGFYASFMVADEVEVVTRRAGESTATRWVSKGDGQYAIGDAERDEAGTTIKLSLKAADAEAGLADFSDEWVLRDIVKRYSDFVAYPVKLAVVEVPPASDDGTIELPTRRDVDEPLNSMKAIWTRPESDVSDEDYAEFYRHITHDFAEPLLRVRTSIEGTFEARALLFLPSKAPFDLYHRERSGRGVQLYVRRVFIMDECRELLPDWLRFVRGVVDAEDLPLNVSREMLQQDGQIRSIRKHLVKKVCETLAELAESDAEQYRAFYAEFGPVLREGLLDLQENRERILDLLLAPSTADDTKPTSLAEYVARMPESQEEIYFMVGSKLDVLRSSPHLEAFRARGVEVLFFADQVDEVWLAQSPPAYRGKSFRNIGRGDVTLGSDEEQAQEKETRQKEEESFQGLLQRVRTELQEHVKEVRLSSRLQSSPSCLVLEEGDLSPQLEAMLRQGGQEVPESRPILELNPQHPILTKLGVRYDANPDDARIGEAARALFAQAVLAEGGQLDDPTAFCGLVSDLLSEVL